MRHILRVFTLFLLIFGIVLFVLGCSPNSSGSQTSVYEQESSNVFDTPSSVEDFSLTLNEVDQKYIRPYGELVYHDDWSSPKEIKVSMLVNWYREYISQTKTPEEIEKLYATQNGMGFVYPSQEFEPFVQKYFSISSNEMRVQDSGYEPKLDGYRFLGGGIGEKLHLQIDNIQTDLMLKKSVLTITADCVNQYGKVKSRKELSIQLENNGQFKYISYKTIN